MTAFDDGHNPSRPGAIILCGGASRRMGSEKHLLPIGDEVFLQRICRSYAEVTETIVVVAAAGQTMPELPKSVTVTRDEVPDQGPLAGLATGMAALRQLSDNTSAAWAATCDAPFVNTAVLTYLYAQLAEHEAVHVKQRDGLHAFPAVFRLSVESTIRDLLAKGQRRMQDLLQTLSTVCVPDEDLKALDPELRCLQNINTREDYERLVAGQEASFRTTS